MEFVKSADGATSRPAEQFVMINSAQIYVGGPVKLVAGGVDAADAVDDPIYGVCVGFKVAGGNTPIQNALSSQYDGTWVSTVGSQNYTAASDNQTDKMVVADVIPVLEGDTFLIELNATKATTTGSGTAGYTGNVDTAAEYKFDEDTATTGVEQFLIVNGNPIPAKNGNMVYVKVTERQL